MPERAPISAGRAPRLAAAAAFALLTACGRTEPAGPVRDPLDASRIAQQALRSARLDEEVVSAERDGDAWIVTTRWRETSAAGHLVTVDAANGAVRVERYRTVQLGGPP